MGTHAVELISRPELAGEQSVLRLVTESADSWYEQEARVWVKVHVGVVFRKSSSRRPPTAQHREDWAWFDFESAGAAMEGLRKPGTSVLVLSTWCEARRHRRELVLRPTRCEVLLGLHWTVRFDRRAAETAHASLVPGEEAVSKLLPVSRTKWRYEGRDRRAWESVQLRLVEEGSQRRQTPARLTPTAGQLRLF